ncbi:MULTISPECIES: tyrosine-type recombinase/integrase [Vibrio]|uniref:tyrosine-type recombinase/integrase n=1 Tax=Vibrio TaxID=662 RepID=UPI00193D97A1|nr:MULTISPECIES: site-specific integrase [Vibrio]EHP5030802.1 site-specific integrase [Vibrio cholerae]EKO3967060.1 site-specific integrase [Vibrio fluvialis]MBM5447158.1 site-specific integrase [Vibrio parahaemolyticus]MCF9559725.1 site-specific integrase [Vibrio parahaemolyticus]MCG3760682.1 site-specific integrase [Vibrio cincinnatiensis]
MAKGHFAKSEKQAASVMKEMQGKGNVIESVGTARNYEQSLKTCCDYLKEFKLGSLREMTPEKANTYLELRAQECSQKTIDMDRQALQAMMQHVTHELKETDKLDVIKSSVETVESSRSYTPEQVNAIIQHQTEHHALSTQLCYESGLRAHELHTLRPSGEVNPSPRDVHQDKFSHLPNDSKTYTVEGKGGLIREVQIPNHLAEKLEERRLDTPQQISDRGVNYESHYNIAGGHKFSDAFSKASSRALGFSNGAHGLRHSYAQNRYEQLANHFERIDVMTIISQELGHFRPDITEVYLR